AEPVELVPQAVLTVAVGYGDLNPVEATLTAHGVAPERAFGEGVIFTVELPEADAAALAAALTDATAGRAVITRPDPV
ncbi:MAG: DUF1949 domain-containing protein, partial [Myxococcales bacterium]|nr:DUF1949 domain-containing protein [Myxococcales bacterium]